MIDPIPLLLRLLIAHLAADFFLQSAAAAGRRERGWRSIGYALIYALLVWGASGAWEAWFWLMPVLFVSHVLIDGAKARLPDNLGWFLLDQAAHLAVLGWLWTRLDPGALPLALAKAREAWLSRELLTILLGYLAVLWPAGYLTGCLIRPFRDRLPARGEAGLEKAGLWIGLLERFLTYSFVLTGHGPAIGILVAAKSVFRFGEIRDAANRAQVEYILIGSLLSFGFALAAGYLVKALTGL